MTRIVLNIMTAAFLLALAGCSFSGAPSKAFPKQVGAFTLSDGPTAEKKEKGDASPVQYLSEYKTADGASVTNYITQYPSAEEAKKALSETTDRWESGALRETESFEKSGNKSIYTRKDDRTRILWVRDTWLCDVSSKDRETAQKFIDSLPYK